MLNRKVVVITGGVGLLGKAFCEGIIKNNGISIIADINETEGKRFEEELKMLYGSENAFFQNIDITSARAIIVAIETLKKKYGKIDALVNNAYPRNKNYGRHFFDVKYEDFCTNTNLHLGGYFLMCQQFAKYFYEQKSGNIINIASIYGLIAPRFEIYKDTMMTTPIEYALIKSSILQLTKYLAKYLKGSGVRVNAISPGGIYDKQPRKFLDMYKSFALSKGMLDKEDLVGTLIFLLSESSKYINGQNIIVDDGFVL